MAAGVVNLCTSEIRMRLLIISILFVSLLATSTLVRAHEGIEHATPEEAAAHELQTTPAPTPTPELEPDRMVLYQALVEDYTTKQRQFSLSRAQLQSIQTLRSLEEAVVATTAVLISRDRVLTTYLELLLEKLEATPGIELTIKEKSKDTLIARINWLRAHEQVSMTSVDRAAVNLRSDEFTSESDALVAEARRALMLIRLGQLQTTHDRSMGLYERILERNAQNEGTQLQKVERERAYAEVAVLDQRIASSLRAARESLDERTAPRGRVQNDYAAFVTSLEQPYADLAKYLLYLEELARDTWK